MDVNILKKIIVSQREEIQNFFSIQKMINRDLDISRINNYLSHPNIVVILGARRIGKSTFALMLVKDKAYAYLNFDDERLLDIKADDLDKILQAFTELYGDNEFIILDEIQNVKGWELFANRLRRTKKVIITGSNSNLLSGELATNLTGRYMSITLFPFSFNEYLKLKEYELKKETFFSTKEIANLKNIFYDYLSYGGFPETYKFGRDSLKRTYSDIIEKDIIVRSNIRYKKTFKDILAYLLDNFSNTLSYRKTGNIFNIKDEHTIKNYFDFAINAYLFYLVEKFSFKLKQRHISPKKIYSIDTGIINSLSVMNSKNTGRLLENLVFIELKRRIEYQNQNLEIYYWEGESQKKADFILKKGRIITQIIQVSKDIADKTTKEREITSLILASKELSCDNLIVITEDYENEESFENKRILFIPIYKWLINKSM